MWSSNGGTYLYCVAWAEPFAGAQPSLHSAALGSKGGHPRVIRHADLAAIVSDASFARPDISRANLLAHEQVIAEAMQRSDVLPVRFGTVAQSDTAVANDLLRPLAEPLRRELERVRGSVELVLKVQWQPEWLFAAIAAEDETIRALRDDVAGLDDDTTYWERIELGERVVDAMERMRTWEARRLLDVLAPLARESATEPPLTDMMVLNAAFLVPRERVPTFEARVAALGDAERGRLRFGPVRQLPPYSFARISAPGEETDIGFAQ